MATRTLALMRIAHVRERNAPIGTPWRLAVALDSGGATWADLEAARRTMVTEDPRRAHNAVLFRQPLTTLDAHLGRGLRVAALGEIAETVREPTWDTEEIAFGPPILDPRSLRDFYAFEQHVGVMWRRRGQDVPQAWYRLPIFYFSNTSEVRGPDEPVWAPDGSVELDYELEIGALVDTPAVDLASDRAEQAIGGYFVLNDWSARDLQRDETAVRLGPAKGKDFATSIGPWLVTPEELADVREGKGYALEMSATVNGRELSRGSWSSAHFSFGEMLGRASADVRLRPGDLVGSGTVGTGCLLEVGEERLGRWLEPGDEVVLTVDRLGSLRTPVIARPEGRRAA